MTLLKLPCVDAHPKRSQGRQRGHIFVWCLSTRAVHVSRAREQNQLEVARNIKGWFTWLTKGWWPDVVVLDKENLNILGTTATGGLAVTWFVKFIMRHSVADPFQIATYGTIRNPRQH